MRNLIILISIFILSCSNKTIKTQVIKTQIQNEISFNRLNKLCKKNILFGCQLLDKKFTPFESTRLSVLQGYTNKSSTQISIVHRKEDKFYIVVSSNLGKVLSFNKKHFDQFGSNWRVSKIIVDNLVLNTIYNLYIVTEYGSIIDKRTFQAIDTAKSKPKIAVASYLDDSYDNIQSKIWRQLSSQNPDYLFLIGDNVFANKDFEKSKKSLGPKTLWRRYVETRNRLKLFKLNKLIPTIATWNDSDYGQSSGDRSNPNKIDAKRVFNSFYAQDIERSGLLHGPGVSSYISVFGQNFFFMDNRYFRTKNNTAPPYESHWGLKQETWLFKNLNQNKKTSWLINGSQFFGKYHPWESFQRNQAKNFEYIMRRLKEYNFPLVFLSGDRHLTELIKLKKLNYTTYEITTSGAHSKMATDPWLRYPNPKQIAGSIKHNNYVILSPYLKSNSLHFNVKAFGVGKKIIYNKNLSVQNKINLFEIKLKNSKKKQL